MKFAFHPDFSERREAEIPYIAAFSPMLRAAVGAMQAKEKLAMQIEAVVKDIATNQEIADSLKQPVDGMNVKEVELKTSPNEDAVVIARCFVGWEEERNVWVVWVEGGPENHWRPHFDSIYDPWHEESDPWEITNE